jgi:predicted NBD/HSP70 family sugar kinase
MHLFEASTNATLSPKPPDVKRLVFSHVQTELLPMSGGSVPVSGPLQGPGRNLLRELSEQEVLEIIFHEGPVTRPQLAQRTRLSKATVGAAVDRLEQAGLIHAAGRLHGHRGRSPIAYTIRQNAGYVVGVDIGGTNIRVGAADIFGELIHDEQHQTSKQGSRAVSSQVMEVTARVIERARATHERLLSVGISTPGVVDQATRRVTSLAYNVSPDGGLDPLGAIGARWGVPVLIENNVNLAAVGESWKGVAHGVSTFAFIAIGAGVGMGVVIDDELVRGAHGAAGEIGYLPSSSDPFDRRHRLHGGLEDEIGAEGIVSAFNHRRAGGPAGAHSPREVFELARGGDRDARSVVEHVSRRLGAAIASVIAVTDPELVVLGGGIGSNPQLLEPVRSTVAELIPLTARIETSSLGDKAALHGAITVALREARGQLFTRAAR